jgi:hypothetical protein
MKIKHDQQLHSSTTLSAPPPTPITVNVDLPVIDEDESSFPPMLIDSGTQSTPPASPTYSPSAHSPPSPSFDGHEPKSDQMDFSVDQREKVPSCTVELEELESEAEENDEISPLSMLLDDGWSRVFGDGDLYSEYLAACEHADDPLGSMRLHFGDEEIGVHTNDYELNPADEVQEDEDRLGLLSGTLIISRLLNPPLNSSQIMLRPRYMLVQPIHGHLYR